MKFEEWEKKNEKFIDALNTVANYCDVRFHKGCGNCPMCDNYREECMISGKPTYWYVDKNIISHNINNGAR